MLVVILHDGKAVVIDDVGKTEVTMRNDRLTALRVYNKDDVMVAYFNGEDIVGFYPTLTTRDGREFTIRQNT